MTRDRTALGALLAVALVFACTEGDLAQTPSKAKTSHSDESKDSSSTERDDVDEEDAEEEEEEDSDEVEAPDPPTRKVSDASIAPAEDDKDEGAAAADDVEEPVAAPPARSSGSDVGKPVDGGASTAMTNPAFDAGSGELQPDGQTVIYRIPNGTGRGDWNPKDKPIRVKPGMVLRFIDEDTTAKGDGHWLHTFGQPCPHSARAIGEGYDCKIRADAPAGIVPSTVEHSPSNFGGRVYIFVERDGASTPTR